jgi:hypothetical protein
MAINPVRPEARADAIGSLLVSPNGAQGNRTRDTNGPDRAERQDAIRVELSPEARKAAATAAVTSANHLAAASAEFLASRFGRAQLPRSA